MEVSRTQKLAQIINIMKDLLKKELHDFLQFALKVATQCVVALIFLFGLWLILSLVSCNSKLEENSLLEENPEIAVFEFLYLYEDIKHNGYYPTGEVAPYDSVAFGYTFYSSFDLDYENLISIDSACGQLVEIKVSVVGGYTDLIDSVYLYQKITDVDGDGFEEFLKINYDRETYLWTILNANENCNPY